MNCFKVAKDTFVIDPLIFGIQKFTSVYLIAGETLALFDCGSVKSVQTVLAGIKSLGFDPKDISHIILSHIHFDHGSGAGALLEFMPAAQVCVHPTGYRHIVDPGRLTKSSKRVFGSMIDEWYGGYAAVPEDRIIQVDEGDIIDLGKGRTLQVYGTPGHAQHGICLFDPLTQGLFTGDEAGVYFDKGPVVIPTTPPPDFNPDHNIESIKRLKALKPEILFFAHYAASKDVNQTLDASIDSLLSWKKIAGSCLEKTADPDQVTKALRADAAEKMKPVKEMTDLYAWVMEHHIPMCSGGYVHYFSKLTD